jgi:hypothetical protein
VGAEALFKRQMRPKAQLFEWHEMLKAFAYATSLLHYIDHLFISHDIHMVIPHVDDGIVLPVMM